VRQVLHSPSVSAFRKFPIGAEEGPGEVVQRNKLLFERTLYIRAVNFCGRLQSSCLHGRKRRQYETIKKGGSFVNTGCSLDGNLKPSLAGVSNLP